ncbi:MAG TPA: FAD-dependent oxidoreductase [Methanomassiliicoccales archaeon]|nr:FAD-dependent oxidoreductase [Methanomassiliicoccales archaeon]
MNDAPEVLVIGAGVAGMEASLLLSKAGAKVHLVERTSYTGGTSVLFEQVYPDLECATCMLSPRQQDLLQDPNIEALTLSLVEGVREEGKGFIVTVKKKARFVDPSACIGCGACYDPCPVSAPNEAEQGLSQRKAIHVPFTGALPNVPSIDRELCIRFHGKECQACKEACAFEAINFEQQEESVEIRVDSILVATGSQIMDLRPLARYGLDSVPEVYHALQLERLFAQNGPSSGNIVMRDGKTPRSVALIHCAGRAEKGYCSGVCCMYLLKFNQYFRAKSPDVELHELYIDMTIPGQDAERFYQKMIAGGTDMIRTNDARVENRSGRPCVLYTDASGQKRELTVDMVILAPALEPHGSTAALAKTLGIEIGERGYVKVDEGLRSSRPGIYVVGGAAGPKDVAESVAEAHAAVAEMLSGHREAER